jgi:hypothetical protein
MMPKMTWAIGAVAISLVSVAPRAGADTLMPVWTGHSAAGPAEAGCFFAANSAEWRALWAQIGLESPFDLPESLVALAIVESPSGDCTFVPWPRLERAKPDGLPILYYSMVPDPENVGPAELLTGSGSGTLQYGACSTAKSTYPVSVILVEKDDPRLSGFAGELRYARTRRLDAVTSELLRDCRAP